MARVSSSANELVGEASGVDTNSGSLVNPELHSDEPSLQPALDASNEASQNLECESWLDKLHKELENQGISLPERINDEYLHRFYTAAKGDFRVFLSSITQQHGYSYASTLPHCTAWASLLPLAIP